MFTAVKHRSARHLTDDTKQYKSLLNSLYKFYSGRVIVLVLFIMAFKRMLVVCKTKLVLFSLIK